MGDAQGSRERDMQPFKATAKLVCTAECYFSALPASHTRTGGRGRVIDGPQSAVFDEAENRLHAQKAIMAHIIGENF